jgi:hypothetical protein
MKKNSTVRQSPKRAAARKEGPITIGMDLGRNEPFPETGRLSSMLRWQHPI